MKMEITVPCSAEYNKCTDMIREGFSANKWELDFKLCIRKDSRYNSNALKIPTITMRSLCTVTTSIGDHYNYPIHGLDVTINHGEIVINLNDILTHETSRFSINRVNSKELYIEMFNLLISLIEDHVNEPIQDLTFGFVDYITIVDKTGE